MCTPCILPAYCPAGLQGGVSRVYITGSLVPRLSDYFTAGSFPGYEANITGTYRLQLRDYSRN